MPPKLLTKTRYISGLQCLKYLWMIFHEQDRIAEKNIEDHLEGHP